VGRWIAALALALVVAIFAVQNAEPVPIRFLAWQLPGVSLGILVLAAALVGAAVGGAAGLLSRWRRRGPSSGEPPAPPAP
jgi:putative membrane protein